MRSRLCCLAFMVTVLGLNSCASSLSVGPIEGAGMAGVVGRFALNEPTVNGSGARIMADTLVLGSDSVARRFIYVENETGGLWPMVQHVGTYDLSGSSVLVDYHSFRNGGYGYCWTELTPMTAFGSSRRATQLVVDLPGWKATYDRVPSSD